MQSIEEAYTRIYDQAVALLARRPHSAWELRRKLLEKGRARGATPELVERACARCRELGYLDDAAFAESRARYRLTSCGHGPARVRAELAALRVSARTVEKTLAGLLAEVDTAALAAAALRGRFGGVRSGQGTETGRDGLKERAGKYGFLLRRGFDHEDIQAVLGQADEDEQP